MTKYYFAGSTRIATPVLAPGASVRKYTIPQNMTVEYFLTDHLGSTSITTDANGAKVSEMRYKPCPLRYTSGMLREGEVRYTWTASLTTTPAYRLADYTFTGQYSYMDDPSTAGVTEGFGLMFYNARWYDPSLGRFAQADTIVPGGVQGWDRYAYVNNAPTRFTDPSGHLPKDEWIRLYGEEGWKKITEGLSQELIDFLLSDAFDFGNIAVIELDNGQVGNLLIGEEADGAGISFYDIDRELVYSGDKVFEIISRAVNWGAMQRKTNPDSPNDYFSGGYETASSNSCPHCDENIVHPENLPQQLDHLNFKGYIPANNGFVYVKTQADMPKSIKGMVEYYAGLFGLAAACAEGQIGPCAAGILSGGLMLQDGVDDITDSVIYQQPIIVNMAP